MAAFIAFAANHEVPATLEGKRIVQIRPMNGEEMEHEGWISMPGFVHVCLVLDDGQRLYASQDDEGNGPGALFGRYPNGQTYRVDMK